MSAPRVLTKLLPEDKDKIRALRAGGVPIYALAERFDVSPTTICNVLATAPRISKVVN